MKVGGIAWDFGFEGLNFSTSVLILNILVEFLNIVFLLHESSFSGNGDDNIVLGLSLDKFSDDEKVEVKLGSEYKELSAFCILLCLSLDGKLFMFHVARYFI